MTRHDDPLSPSGGGGPSSKASRLDREIERLRTSPSPMSTNPTLDSVNSFVSGVPWMGIFSRTRDIIAANFNDLLDQADDPAKMIRMIILEMEETLVEVGPARRARSPTRRRCTATRSSSTSSGRLGREGPAGAVEGPRGPRPRGARREEARADMADQLKQEIAVLDDALRAYEQDIQKLQNRLREARSRQTQIAARLESAENRVKLRTLMTNERVDEALTRFDQLERRVDYAEGRADALSIADGTGKPTLADEIAALEGQTRSTTSSNR
jgi:phage shock protein A